MRQCDVHWRNLMNPEVGWWGMNPDYPGCDATLPDEIEHVLRLFPLRVVVSYAPRSSGAIAAALVCTARQCEEPRHS